ncbi:MAG: hypothetical protein HKN80_05455, partial [Acidimicrobiia bacterium]|nr:hypothetical protein [Acidimicrobiia bacterium]
MGRLDVVWSGTKHRRAKVGSAFLLAVSILVAPPSPLASTPALAIGDLIPVSYSMPGGNGTAQGGSADYFDAECGQATSGGTLNCTTGELTDGVIATENYNLTYPNEGWEVWADPYVGWWQVDPTITFTFSAPVDIGKIRVWVDDVNGDGGVSTPASIDITMAGVTNSFDVVDPDATDPFPIDIVTGGLGADTSVSLTLNRQTGWIFVSEVEFFADGSIQGAIDAVPSAPAVYIAEGTYNEALFIGRDVVLQGADSATAPPLVTIDAFGTGQPVVYVSYGFGGAVTLDDLKMSRGDTFYYGGGIDHQGSGTLTVIDSTVSDNASLGAGVFNDAGTLTVVDSAIQFNAGSGIYNRGTATVSGSTISFNEGQSGAGIYNDGEYYGQASFIVSDSVISGNTAEGEGGGAFNLAGHLEILNSEFSDNTSLSDGGGIYSTFESAGGGLPETTILINTTVSGNSTEGNGGGIYNAGDHVELTDSSVVGNTAAFGNGGGIYATWSAGGGGGGLPETTILTNSTVSGNVAISGGGIYSDGDTVDVVGGSVVSGNQATGGSGGGIYVDCSSECPVALTIADSTISNNTVSNGSGGGVYAGYTVSGLVSDSTISRNGVANGSGGMGGGGVANFGDLTITDSTVTLNSANDYNEVGRGSGGGIYNEGDLAILRSTISVNVSESVSSGGGIHNSYGSVSIVDTTVDGNGSAYSGIGGNGGGIENVGGSFDVERSTISNNTAFNSGGGIYNIFGGYMSVRNSTVSGNSAAIGGGIYTSESLNLNNVTVTDNTADFGGGINVAAPSSISTSNSIIAGNTPSDCYGNGLDSFGYNLVGDCNLLNGGGGPLPSDVVGENDPGLDPLADNGGFTATHAPLGASPVIDAGNPGSPGLPPSCEPADQRGFPRPVGDTCDIGAFEFVPASATIVAGYDAARTTDEWGFHESYLNETRAYLFDPANFGPTGTVDTEFVIGPPVSVADATSLEGLDVFFVGYVPAASYTQSEKDALYDFALGGGALIATTDDAGFTMADIFGAVTSSGGTSPSTVTNAGHPIVSSPFGSVSTYNQYFTIGHYSAIGPDAVAIGSNNLGVSLAVIEPDELGSGSGPVVLAADVDIFSNGLSAPSGGGVANETLIKNIFAWVAGGEPLVEAEVGFAYDASSGAEGDTRTVTVVLNVVGGPLTEPVTVTVDDLGVGAAVADVDFTVDTTLVTFDTGSVDGATQLIDVALVADGATEPMESLRLGLSNPTGGATLSEGATEHRVTIAPIGDVGPLAFTAANANVEDDAYPDVEALGFIPFSDLDPLAGLRAGAEEPIDVEDIGSSIGAIGSAIGAIGSPIGAIGSVIGAIGSPIGAIGSSIGAIGSSIGAIGSPIGAISVEAIGSPIGAIGSPIGAIGSPIGAIGSAIGAIGSPIGAIEITNPERGTWDQRLAGSFYEGVPLNALPFGELFRNAPGVLDNPANASLGVLTLGDIDLSGTEIGALSLLSLTFGEITLGQIPGLNPATVCTD